MSRPRSNTLVVDTANDVSDGTTTSIAALLANKGADGKISLREAITAANNTLDGAGGMVDLIQFAIAGGGVKTITLASALPTISDSIFHRRLVAGRGRLQRCAVDRIERHQRRCRGQWIWS